MRDEEEAQREIAVARKEAEEEEKRYQKALDEARHQLESARAQESEALRLKIGSLEQDLIKAKELKERAISRAQLTKSGHVYVISNVGSFGENILKVGMTRRLDPLDRIDELGDASVPFDFDIHAIMYSDNAPALENVLHKHLDEKRVNLANTRKEFFSVSVSEIEDLCRVKGISIQFTKIAEAREYHETCALRKNKQNQPLGSSGVKNSDNEFPKSIFTESSG